MIIHNLSDGKLLIKHATSVDPDRTFGLSGDVSEELMLFDKFFKIKLDCEVIAVQLFEIVDRKTSLADYFSEKTLWEDTPAWNAWFKKFQLTHNLQLYFYEPEQRQKVIFHGNLDMNHEVKPKFNYSADNHESFEVKDYFINELDSTSTIQIDINTDIIYQCLQQSNIPQCRNLIKQFNYELFQKDIVPNSERKNNKLKL